jgi:hypothetical protein
MTGVGGKQRRLRLQEEELADESFVDARTSLTVGLRDVVDGTRSVHHDEGQWKEPDELGSISVQDGKRGRVGARGQRSGREEVLDSDEVRHLVLAVYR